MTHRYIVVEGPLGVGKTALADILAERLGGRRLVEPGEENPFLSAFYQDRRKYAFQAQLFFLLSRYQQQQELPQQDLFSDSTVSDYLFQKDRIFASLNLGREELLLYNRVYDLLGARVPKPDLVIYLQARVDVLLSRIRRRGREYEKKVDAGYLSEVCRAYSDFFFHYNESPLLVVNTSDIDFVRQVDDLNHLLGIIRKMKNGVMHYNPVGA